MPTANADAKGRVRYRRSAGREIRDEETVERMQTLAIPPAWKDVWISPRPTAKLQATGYDKAGRKQYLYHPDFRAAQEQAKYEQADLVSRRSCPTLRTAMAEHLDKDGLDRERVSAVAVRLINAAGSALARSGTHVSRGTYGITTLTKRHVAVRGHRVHARFRGKHAVQVERRSSTTSSPQRFASCFSCPRADACSDTSGRATFIDSRAKRLNDYVKLYLGPDFSAKDFRTWGGTLLAAVAFAEHAERHGFPETKAEEKRSVSAVMRRVARELGNTAAVCRASYVSPAVIDQYLDGRTIEDFRPRHLRAVGARDTGLDPEELSLLSLLRSWRIRRARAAA